MTLGGAGGSFTNVGVAASGTWGRGVTSVGFGNAIAATVPHRGDRSNYPALSRQRALHSDSVGSFQGIVGISITYQAVSEPQNARKRQRSVSRTANRRFVGDREQGRVKAWVNRALEENPVPTIWMSNSIAGIDAAVIRRFDQVIELPIPPRAQRTLIIRERCQGLLGDREIAFLSGCEQLAPAIVSRSAEVVSFVRKELGNEAGATLMELVTNVLRAQGHQVTTSTPADDVDLNFELEFVRADADLKAVLEGLARSRSGRLCLYGPSGTGKTAYARYLADQLDLPLHAKRASDLLSKYVGESEKNVARAFGDARQDGGILLVDEADSLLLNRQGAERSWQVSLTNELLTCGY